MAASPSRGRVSPILSRLFWPRIIKRWLPNSLMGRSLLIFVLPVALMQLAVGWVFIDNHWQTETEHLSDTLAGDIAWLVESYENDPSNGRFEHLAERAHRTLGLTISLSPGAALADYSPPPVQPLALFAPVDQPLRQSLTHKLGQPVRLDNFGAHVEIQVGLRQGVLDVIAPRSRAFADREHQFLVWLVVFTLVSTLIAVLFTRNQVRAIERLADAADAFGRGGEVPRFKPHGASEVRKAAFAFIAMKERIQRYIDQRTALLASVSHDLRTPLTRLKLEAALAEPSPRVAAIQRDLAEMEHMIDEYLAFARGEGGEASQIVALRELIEAVGEGAVRSGVCLTVDADPALAARVRPHAFKRALSNLVMNAAAHGSTVAVAARGRVGGGIEILVDDDGPGIPPDRYEEAFKPFSRLDEARNQNHKGVGLGLAIARDVARSLGGEITLDRSPLGGLRAIVQLPG
jgi:two-component system, OmpR family, osmolarity sensor histidine kinase EnvZ